MTWKDSRLKWLAGILLISALGLGFAIEHATSRSVTEDVGTGVEASPAVEISASASVPPLVLLLNNRRRQRGSPDQGPPKTQLDRNEPAQAAETPSDTAAPSSPIDPTRSVPKSQATEEGPPGIPISPENLGRDTEALRANPTGPTSPR